MTSIQKNRDPARRHCLPFSSLAYDLTSRGRKYELNAKIEKAD